MHPSSPPKKHDPRRLKRALRIGGAVTVPAYIVVMFFAGLVVYPERTWQDSLIYAVIGASVLAVVFGLAVFWTSKAPNR